MLARVRAITQVDQSRVQLYELPLSLSLTLTLTLTFALSLTLTLTLALALALTRHQVDQYAYGLALERLVLEAELAGTSLWR